MYVAKHNSLKQASQIIAEDDLIQNIQYIEHTTNMHVLGREINVQYLWFLNLYNASVIYIIRVLSTF